MFLIAHQPSYKFSAPPPRIPLIWERAQGIVSDFTKTLHPLTQLQLTQSCVHVYGCNSASSQPQSWEAMTRAQWVHTIDTAGDLRRHIAVPRLSCLSGAQGWFHQSSAPLFTSQPSLFFSSLVLGSRKNWKSGSAWKWHHQQKEMDTVKVSKHERERENTVKCSVIVMQPPLKYPPSPPLWESAQPGPLLSFLPAAGQNYDVIGCNVSDRSDESSTKQNSERNFTVKPFCGGIKLEVV